MPWCMHASIESVERLPEGVSGIRLSLNIRFTFHFFRGQMPFPQSFAICSPMKKRYVKYPIYYLLRVFRSFASLHSASSLLTTELQTRRSGDSFPVARLHEKVWMDFHYFLPDIISSLGV